ncbi:hypothetical protein BCR44DRAFT_1103736 [Catenaria anguillulae PL171]|uniref:Uncharacterized protein n=1 Tax=Catenaria anguillulae PL171 TaxID=765915 RepID=A0A1Y2I461_9FUNG|nr:hypothetical protein BCR44DRAFT_1103736 [Catenaria anguillulae PL171]
MYPANPYGFGYPYGWPGVFPGMYGAAPPAGTNPASALAVNSPAAQAAAAAAAMAAMNPYAAMFGYNAAAAAAANGANPAAANPYASMMAAYGMMSPTSAEFATAAAAGNNAGAEYMSSGGAPPTQPSARKPRTRRSTAAPARKRKVSKKTGEADANAEAAIGDGPMATAGTDAAVGGAEAGAEGGMDDEDDTGSIRHYVVFNYVTYELMVRSLRVDMGFPEFEDEESMANAPSRHIELRNAHHEAGVMRKKWIRLKGRMAYHPDRPHHRCLSWKDCNLIIAPQEDWGHIVMECHMMASPEAEARRLSAAGGAGVIAALQSAAAHAAAMEEEGAAAADAEQGPTDQGQGEEQGGEGAGAEQEPSHADADALVQGDVDEEEAGVVPASAVLAMATQDTEDGQEQLEAAAAYATNAHGLMVPPPHNSLKQTYILMKKTFQTRRSRCGIPYEIIASYLSHCSECQNARFLTHPSSRVRGRALAPGDLGIPMNEDDMHDHDHNMMDEDGHDGYAHHFDNGDQGQHEHRQQYDPDASGDHDHDPQQQHQHMTADDASSAAVDARAEAAAMAALNAMGLLPDMSAMHQHDHQLEQAEQHLAEEHSEGHYGGDEDRMDVDEVDIHVHVASEARKAGVAFDYASRGRREVDEDYDDEGEEDEVQTGTSVSLLFSDAGSVMDQQPHDD